MRISDWSSDVCSSDLDHPYLRDYGGSFNYDDHFDSPDKVRRAVAGYLGLCSFLDENIGKVLATLEDCGLMEETRVLYTSDHGDNLGTRGLWGKSTMYEETAGVPLILAGPEVPVGAVCDTPVTHVDAYTTIVEGVGIPLSEEERERKSTRLNSSHQCDHRMPSYALQKKNKQ